VLNLLDEIKGIPLSLYLLMVRMKLKLTKQRQEPLQCVTKHLSAKANLASAPDFFRLV
jgi:hypothetical protein